MGNDQLLFVQKEISKKKKINKNKKSKSINSDSPFAVLGSYYLQVGFIDKGAIFLGISLGAKNVILLYNDRRQK